METKMLNKSKFNIFSSFRLLIFLVFFAGFSFYSCNNNDNPEPKVDYLSSDETNIIQLVLAPISASYAIVNTTDTSSYYLSAEHLELEEFGVNQTVLDAARLANKELKNIPPENFSTTLPWITRKEYSEKTFKEISEEYGVVGVFQFSRPYIYNDTLAIMEASQYCGPLCGNGFFIVAEKEGETWVKRADKVTWISK